MKVLLLRSRTVLWQIKTACSANEKCNSSVLEPPINFYIEQQFYYVWLLLMLTVVCFTLKPHLTESAQMKQSTSHFSHHRVIFKRFFLGLICWCICFQLQPWYVISLSCMHQTDQDENNAASIRISFKSKWGLKNNSLFFSQNSADVNVHCCCMLIVSRATHTETMHLLINVYK